MKKEIKIAEIVPVSSLEKTKDNQYHMCLAHLVQQSDEYAKFYRRMSNEGKYVLIDNGAAEGSQLDIINLMYCYEKINPAEIVLPDTLCDSISTLEKSLSAYNLLSMSGFIPRYKVMFVPQGKTFGEWKECAMTALNKMAIDTIGVSKFLEMETGDNNIRLDAVRFLEDWMQENNKEFEIHLLGCSEGPEKVRLASEVSDYVRGCDSAFAYICTQAGVMIDEKTKRPVGEIDFINGTSYDGLEENMKNFEKAVGVDDNTETESWR